MTSYKHTQIGYVSLFVWIAFAVFCVWLALGLLTEIGSHFFPMVAIMALILFATASFVTLTVTIDENYVRVKFGYGIFQKKFPLRQIVSTKTVKNHWY